MRKNTKKHARKPVYAPDGILKSICTNKEMRKATLFTLLFLLIYRIGCAIPTPGTYTGKLVQELSNNSMLAMMSMIGGGSLSNFSIFALGVTPYITASIIVQMLSMDVIPALTEMSKNGEKGRIKLNRVTKWVGIVLAVLQSLAMVRVFDLNYGLLVTSNWKYYVYIIAIQTAGYSSTVWLADSITRHGITNGMSLIIAFGIITNIPSTMMNAYTSFISGTEGSALALGCVRMAVFILVYLLIVISVIFMETSERRIHMRYANQSYMQFPSSSYLPIKVNPSNVIPVIFAQSFINIAMLIASAVSKTAYQEVQNYLSFDKWYGLLIYAGLILLFSFGYTYIELDPEEMADNLSKSGAYIPSVRPGKDTETYIYKVSMRVNVAGAIGLTLLALLPYVLTMLTDLSVASAIGGTGIIIVVGVAMETVRGLRTAAMPAKKPILW